MQLKRSFLFVSLSKHGLTEDVSLPYHSAKDGRGDYVQWVM